MRIPPTSFNRLMVNRVIHSGKEAKSNLLRPVCGLDVIYKHSMCSWAHGLFSLQHQGNNTHGI